MQVLTGQKHLIRCRCVLPQFKRSASPPSHQFTVFSVIDDDRVRMKFAQCPNCGLVHRVTEIGVSEIVTGREDMVSIVSIDDIRASLPERLVDILTVNGADLPSWEAARFIYENAQWGGYVTLSTDVEGDVRQGKYVRILGTNLFSVDTFIREEVVK